jgi:hypothetical protein
MRLITLSLILAFGMSATPLASGVAQTAPDTTTKVKKPPSKLGKLAKGLVDPAATAAAGAGVQAVLGNKAGGVASALGGVAPCGTGYGVTAGSAIVGAAKGIVKQAGDATEAAAAIPCPPATAIPGIPGLSSTAGAGAAVAGAALGGVLGGAAPGASPLGGMGGMGAVASMTPVGLAVGAAPGAIKGLKGVFGAKPQDKTAMLRELGKGRLELKYAKFIEGTLEFEPGFEASFASFAEAIALVEGTYLMHVSPEAPREKNGRADTALSRKRVAKVWALMAASGVSDHKVFAVSELPAPLAEGRKLPKAGTVKIEIIKFDKQP